MRRDAPPLERLAAELWMQHFFLGVYTLVSGRTPA